MGLDSIVERIISDAKKEAEDIISDAEKRAEDTVSEAKKQAERKLTGVKAETAQKVKSILDGKAATARLDCAKCELSEKRRVIDTLYFEALKSLIALGKKETVAIADRLLNAYAEKGDEIVFAPNYKYAEDVLKLDIVKELGLTHSVGGAGIDGGFVLKGKIADKDVSYTALLALDREENESSIAAKIFAKG